MKQSVIAIIVRWTLDYAFVEIDEFSEFIDSDDIGR